VDRAAKKELVTTLNGVFKVARVVQAYAAKGETA
jgi:hypothetical protein